MLTTEYLEMPIYITYLCLSRNFVDVRCSSEVLQVITIWVDYMDAFIFFSFFLESVFASLPQMDRGVSKVIGGDPKGNHFLYTNGKSVIIRNIEVSLHPLKRQMLLSYYSLWPLFGFIHVHF